MYHNWFLRQTKNVITKPLNKITSDERNQFVSFFCGQKQEMSHSLFSILNDIFCSFVNLEDGTTQITTNHQLSLLLFSLIWKETIDIVPASHSMKSAVQPNPNKEQ